MPLYVIDKYSSLILNVVGVTLDKDDDDEESIKRVSVMNDDDE